MAQTKAHRLLRAGNTPYKRGLQYGWQADKILIMPKDIERINAERQTCRQKKNYGSIHDAEQAARLQETIFNQPFRVYHCIWCRDWHLSTKGAKYGD